LQTIDVKVKNKNINIEIESKFENVRFYY